MKTLLAIVTLSSLVVAVGCQSPQGGGVSNDERFTIVTPVLPTTLKQGETSVVTISLKRGDAFKRDVTLDIRPSKGISVEPTQALVKGNEKADVQLRISAAKNADLGAYKILIKGTPAAGEATSTEFSLNVVSP